MRELDEEKLFYERFWALHNDPVLLSIVHHFGIGIFRRSSVLEGFAEILTEHDFRGERCVEIGTCKGLTALVLARFFREVVTVDIVPDVDRQKIADFCGIRNVRFVTVRDNKEKADLISRLQFDAAYVDGDHASDTQSDFDLVKQCGRVLFHEYWSPQPDVVRLVNGLAGKVITRGKFALWTR